MDHDAQTLGPLLAMRRAARTGGDREQERAIGIADHGTVVSRDLVSACLQAIGGVRAIYPAFTSLITGLVLDGYELATLVTGVAARAQGRRFARRADAMRFAHRAARGGAALLAGPLGDTVRPLLPTSDPDHAALHANAFAAGILLFVHEHQVQHAAFAGLAVVPTAKPARASKLVHAGVAPPRPDLLAEIRAAPADDAPRLVYADWLIAHGDPRGELIVLQCALGRTVLGAGAQAVIAEGRVRMFDTADERAARERALLKQHETAWLAPIRRAIREWRWRRGFPSHVIADAAAFIQHYDAICDVPLDSAKLTGMKRGLAASLGALPPHPTLRFLDVSRNRLAADDLRALATPFVARVAWLDLWGNPLEDAGADVLAAPAFAGVRRLCLADTGMSNAGLDALTRAPFWPALERLRLGYAPGAPPPPAVAAKLALDDHHQAHIFDSA